MSLDYFLFLFVRRKRNRGGDIRVHVIDKNHGLDTKKMRLPSD